ncbi:MAG: Uma2 family endonuclease [Chloroflexota bacterium]|nr:Uma2 family endonuclease [Chloroflexota bacterium]
MQTVPESVSMAEAPTTPETFELIIPPSGEIVARDVSWEDFLANKNWEHVEWVDGWVVKMAGIELSHDGLTGFLRLLFTAFLELTGIGGRIFQDPVLIRLKSIRAGRAPDLMLLLPENDAEYVHNYVRGAPDLIVEIVSPSSDKRDRVDKFREYEQAGVREYWILDPRFRELAFYQLDDNGEYERIAPDENGVYTSRVLPQFRLEVALLWRDPLPGVLETLEILRVMLAAPAADTKQEE